MTPKRIEIITDSTCDLPQSLLEEYSITVLPHVLIWGEQQYRDRIDLLPEEFYRRLVKEKVMPTTSQATAQDFATAYECARERGADEIVAVLLNSHFSGALQSAKQAVEDARLPVYVHDSRNATMGLGWQVLAAARAREQGGDAADMLAAAEYVRDRTWLYICLDTLEYVYRGGRIGHATRLVGAMLNVKPLIYVDPGTGIVEPGGMALTRRRAIDLLYDKFFAQMGQKGRMHVAVMHGDAAEEAGVLYERIQQNYHPSEMVTNITCPTLGINTGPHTIALAGYTDERG